MSILDDLILFIPTKDRTEHQHTFDALPQQWQDRTALICPEEEVSEHEARGRMAMPRPECQYVPQARDYMIRLSGGKVFLMMDDDLRFARRVPGKTNLVPATPEDIDWMINTLWEASASEGVGLVGLSSRQGNNYLDTPWSYNTRIHACYMVNPVLLKLNGIKFGDVKLMEDHHINLSLLERGYHNQSLAEMCWDQASNSPGGCSTYRTKELQTEAAHRLHELHEAFVTVVVKQPKTAWKGEERHDVRIAWKKAWQRGQFMKGFKAGLRERRKKALEEFKNA